MLVRGNRNDGTVGIYVSELYVPFSSFFFSLDVPTFFSALGPLVKSNWETGNEGAGEGECHIELKKS